MTRPKPNKKQPCKAALEQRFKWLLRDLKDKSAHKAAGKLRDAWRNLLKHFTQSKKTWTLKEAKQWSSDLAPKLNKVIESEKRLIGKMGVPRNKSERKKLIEGAENMERGSKFYGEAMKLYGAAKKELGKAEKMENYYRTLVKGSGTPGGPFMIVHFAAYKGAYASEARRKKGDEKWRMALRYLLDGEEQLWTLKWKITKQILKKKYCIDLFWKYGTFNSQETVLHKMAPKYLSDKQRKTYKLQQEKRSKLIRNNLRRLRPPR